MHASNRPITFGSTLIYWTLTVSAAGTLRDFGDSCFQYLRHLYECETFRYDATDQFLLGPVGPLMRSRTM